MILLRDHFCIGLVIGPRLVYWPEATPKANTASRGPITRPIQKWSRNDIFIN